MQLSPGCLFHLQLSLELIDLLQLKATRLLGVWHSAKLAVLVCQWLRTHTRHRQVVLEQLEWEGEECGYETAVGGV